VPVACDDNGNLTSRTDARGAVTTMTYDALNQRTKKGTQPF
jgi:YD repeat-containing protein